MQLKCGKGKDQKDVVMCSAYFPSDSVEMPSPAEFKELIQYCSEKKQELLVRSDANVHYMYGVAWTSTYGNVSWHWFCYTKTKAEQQLLLQT